MKYECILALNNIHADIYNNLMGVLFFTTIIRENYSCLGKEMQSRYISWRENEQ